MRSPGGGRQGERLAPQFQTLQQALVAEHTQLAETTEAPDPELVAVFDLAGTVDGFMRACQGIEGLDFLADLQEDQVAADDDFYYEDGDEVSDDGVPQSLYMVMSNAVAVAELVRLFELWQHNPTTTFERGLNPLKQIFGLLRSIRRWGPEDRIRETGLLEEWQDTVDAIGGAGVARVEIELWYRADATRRTAAEAAVVDLVSAAGGQTIRTSVLPEIQFHGLLADIPYAQVAAVLSEGPDAIELLTAESVMFVTPARPMALPTTQPTVFGLSEISQDAMPGAVARIALLDGLPLANHLALEGRVLIDDPDDRAAAYGSGQQSHGTAMAGLIVHGDLTSPGSTVSGPLYIRPILQPHAFFPDVELVVPDEILVDLIHRSFHRMFEGDGTHQPAAAGVRVVNLSIGDPARMFIRRLSPLAKLLDWLAHRYNILIVVSAGNHEASPQVPSESIGDPDHLHQAVARSQYATLRTRRLLSPAEAVNVVTVGAQHTDGVDSPMPDTVIDAFEQNGPAGYSAAGFGFRRSVKPEVLLPGGREIFLRPPVGDGDLRLESARVAATGPGIRVAAPGLAGEIDGSAYTCGSSNAAALATRTIDQIYTLLEGLAADEGEFDFPDAQYHPVLAKALLIHAARWGDVGVSLRDQLGLSPQRRRRDLTQLLGYGPVEPERVATAGRTRPVLIGAGSITKDKRQTFRFPLPTALSATTEWRRLTVTLAWISQVNTRSQKHRMARLAVHVPRTDLAVEPMEADHNAVLRGTVQHQVLEGQAVVGFIAGSAMEISVDCRVDAGSLSAPVRYGLVAAVEVASTVQVDLHAQVRDAIREQVQERLRSQVAVR